MACLERRRQPVSNLSFLFFDCVHSYAGEHTGVMRLPARGRIEGGLVEEHRPAVC
jgi:hypothetical protein